MDTELLHRLPHPDALASLPRGAQLALAARCLHRVRDLLAGEEGAHQQELRGAVTSVIATLEQCAAAPAEVAVADDQLAERLESLVARCAREGRVTSLLVASAACVAFDCARRTLRDCHVRKQLHVFEVLRVSVLAALAYQYSLGLTSNGMDCLVEAIHGDLDVLLSASVYQHWTDQSPVPQEGLCSLWPLGRPAFWPQSSQSAHHKGRPAAPGTGTPVPDASIRIAVGERAGRPPFQLPRSRQPDEKRKRR